ncbi:SDR family NAD(P)-dependent oxidoreductase [Xanthomonas prunicola]|jgi:NAD(P)-dependent dehydrogenase (short-subunit alcohol dehydrogenase family)|uniref:3-oxoacyl-ACP reductase n=1 Tax=Xanthomonas prunicola TaxID=2053930 RepID=A0A2N3RGW2_9XANT|nr:SDR family oxidoreductase [Xanthomonas prunicola]PKV11742.1 3-oxoacyl-ACP reductase [Xanthomonas prunicola]PKV16051.1 3-oxoacyl-ACP reductase [Xanthomonas prunicola]PKV20313.1 3-oxoacyl-ACP reductase [Xanthomonas prunicola]
MNTPAHTAFSLNGKTILVTGASSGLGQEIAIACAQRGARIVLAGRDKERLAQTQAQLQGTGHVGVLGDLTSAADREALAAAAGATVHGLVHCAGMQKHCPIRQLTEAAMTEMYTVNFLAPVMLTQRLLQANAIAPQGSIVFMLSTAAHLGTRGVGPYSAMKAGLIGIIKCLALEQAKRRIRVNGISPSAVATPMWGEDQLEAQKARHPLGLGKPQDVANAAIYLLADASRWVTGTSLVMDGGSIL